MREGGFGVGVVLPAPLYSLDILFGVFGVGLDGQDGFVLGDQHLDVATAAAPDLQELRGVRQHVVVVELVQCQGDHWVFEQPRQEGQIRRFAAFQQDLLGSLHEVLPLDDPSRQVRHQLMPKAHPQDPGLGGRLHELFQNLPKFSNFRRHVADAVGAAGEDDGVELLKFLQGGDLPLQNPVGVPGIAGTIKNASIEPFEIDLGFGLVLVEYRGAEVDDGDFASGVLEFLEMGV